MKKMTNDRKMGSICLSADILSIEQQERAREKKRVKRFLASRTSHIVYMVCNMEEV